MKTGRERTAWILLLILPALFLTALLLGRYGVRIDLALKALFHPGGEMDVLRSLILRVRLPRVLAATCIGANLAVSGAAFQGLFRNPLVDSRILGISGGAAFGAALALLFTADQAVIQGSSFLFALIAITGVAAIGLRFGSSTLVLIIAGVLVSALFTALLGLLKYVADPLSQLPAITYWLLGGLNNTRWADLGPLLAMTSLGLIFFGLIRWRLNVLTLSDAEAAALGIHVRPFRLAVIGVATIMIAASVAVAGTIGWIGLVVPHLARAWVGPDHARALPVAAAIGAITLIGLDTIARTATSSEIPLGILTGLFGVPAFFLLFFRLMHQRGALQ